MIRRLITYRRDSQWSDIPWLEVDLVLLCLQVDQAGEQKDHIPALVHDWAMAERASDLAWELVLDAL